MEYTYCTMLRYLTTSDHQIYRVTPLKTIYNLHVRNYNHLFHSYTFTQFANTTL
jgi:hypothetical protein